jgi:hypothetical protein
MAEGTSGTAGKRSFPVTAMALSSLDRTCPRTGETVSITTSTCLPSSAARDSETGTTTKPRSAPATDATPKNHPEKRTPRGDSQLTLRKEFVDRTHWWEDGGAWCGYRYPVAPPLVSLPERTKSSPHRHQHHQQSPTTPRYHAKLVTCILINAKAYSCMHQLTQGEVAMLIACVRTLGRIPKSGGVQTPKHRHPNTSGTVQMEKGEACLVHGFLAR